MSTKAVVVMNRAKRGLYAGRHIQFGNKVSEDGGNKSRRTWKPNVQTKRLFSLALDKYIRVNVTMHALRCIDKAGGIDEYLLRIPDQKMENDTAVFWKHQIAAVYQRLASTEIAIPVQNPEESSFSMKSERGKMPDANCPILAKPWTEWFEVFHWMSAPDLIKFLASPEIVVGTFMAEKR